MKLFIKIKFDDKIDSLKNRFYNKNKVNFKLKDDFYNVSYIILPSINNNLKMIISRLRNFLINIFF